MIVLFLQQLQEFLDKSKEIDTSYITEGDIILAIEFKWSSSLWIIH